MKNFKVLLFVMLNFAAIAGLAYVGYYLTNNQLGNEQVSASSESGIYLKMITDVNNSLSVGQEIEVGVHVSLRSSDYASAAEVVVGFNTSYLEAISINEESSDYLGLYKSTNNNQGVATIDVAVVGQGEFEDNERIAKIRFRVKNANTPSTEVTVRPESTLGVPDITTQNGNRNLEVPINIPRNNGIELRNSTNAPANGYGVNGTVSIEVVSDIAGSYPIDRAEVVIDYDANILEYTGFTPVSGLSIEYDGNSSGNGKVYIDYASTSETSTSPRLNDNTVMFRVNFRIKQLGVSNTTVSVDAQSTLGSPNTLSNNKLGSYDVPLLFAYCGDGVVQTPNAQGVNEACDDGNNNDGDQCSAICKNSCTAPSVWDGQQCATPRRPFNGQAVTLPGKIFLYEFDEGENGESYFDTTIGNGGTSNSRQNTDADITRFEYEVSTKAGVVDFVPGEWMEYTVNVTQGGQQSFQLRASTHVDDRVTGANNQYAQVDMLVDGNKVGTFHVGPTDYTFETPNGSTTLITQDLLRSYIMKKNISSGQHVIRLEHKSGPKVNGVSLEMANLPAGCAADYTGDGQVNVADLIVFAQNYNQSSIQCRYDLLGGDCYLNILDLQIFATNYKQANACIL